MDQTDATIHPHMAKPKIGEQLGVSRCSVGPYREIGSTELWLCLDAGLKVRKSSSDAGGGMGEMHEELIVDVHCHLFNASDLPIEGFVQHVQLKNRWGADKLAPIARKLTRGAPSYAEDKLRIEHVIGLHHSGEESAPADSADQRAEVDAELALAELTEDERQVIADALADPTGGPELFGPNDLMRYVKWARMFASSRWDLAERYAKTFRPRAVLAIPMLVDLDHGVVDQAATPIPDQVRVFDLLSQASMLGLVPGTPQLRLHPFVGFDPFRQLDGKLSDGKTAVEMVQHAILEHDFVGVKVYPEMGWRPDGNTAANAGSTYRAKELDAILDAFFGWCDGHDVPITAHCNFSNFSNKDWESASLGNPEHWLPVLGKHAGLRLNLGHFGGAHPESTGYSWTEVIAKSMGQLPGRLFADVGCHNLDHKGRRESHFQVLRRLVDEHPAVADQLMLGTDWYMLAGQDGAEKFIERYRDGFAEIAPDGGTGFMGHNALRFLGFDRTNGDGNAGRLRRKYADLGVERPDWLVEGALS